MSRSDVFTSRWGMLIATLGMAVGWGTASRGRWIPMEAATQVLSLLVGHHAELDGHMISAIQRSYRFGNTTIDLVAKRAPSDG